MTVNATRPTSDFQRKKTRVFEVLLLETLVNPVHGENLDDLLREPSAPR